MRNLYNGSAIKNYILIMKPEDISINEKVDEISYLNAQNFIYLVFRSILIALAAGENF